MKESSKRIIRHEIIHAFLFESGLAFDTIDGWAVNEEMIDYFARQLPKIFNACLDIDIL